MSVITDHPLAQLGSNSWLDVNIQSTIDHNNWYNFEIEINSRPLHILSQTKTTKPVLGLGYTLWQM